MTTEKPTLAQIAERIDVHLKRLERDPTTNKDTTEAFRQRPYWHPSAHRGGAYVRICYISYRAHSSATRQDALAYLAYLDGGGVGRHFEFLLGKDDA